MMMIGTVFVLLITCTCTDCRETMHV